MSTIVTLPAPGRRHHKPAVIALHCSGGAGRQWRALTAELGADFTVISPDLIGSGATGHWHGHRPFRLADEAAVAVDIVDGFDGPVHLVGHSYGGGVALRVAVERPHRVASLSLYEPTAFHVLRAVGEDGRAALSEISNVAASINAAVLVGAYRAGARRFIDYWNGDGAFDALKPSVQVEIVRYLPKGSLDFRALIDERTPLAAYRRLHASTLLMRGETTPAPSALVTRKLAEVLRPRVMETVSGAGHMGPVTHPEAVARTMAAHIRRAQALAEPVAAEPLRAAA
jgi:pimeloyl-ACP methyl ester carboxylesterase